MSPSAVPDDRRPDHELVAAYLDGDKAAYATLYRRHRDRVFALCLRMMRDREAALDRTQDVFLRLMGRLDRFDGRSAFTTWLHRVTVNACYDDLRRRVPDPVDPARAAEHADRPHDDADGAAALDVRHALQALPADQRAAVVLHDLVGHSYEEVAGICDVPMGTVKSRLARGRLRLSRILCADGNIPDETGRLSQDDADA